MFSPYQAANALLSISAWHWKCLQFYCWVISRERIISSTGALDLHSKILELRGCLTLPPDEDRATIRLRHHTDIDLAAIKRRLWTSMEKRGCKNLWRGNIRLGHDRSRGDKPVDCVCHRCASQRLLHYLQILA